jgi:hypothetical protein
MRACTAFRNAGVITILAALFCLCGCDLFGPNFREIAGSYRLKRVTGPQFVFCLPRQDGGAIIDEIGWHKPIIIFRASGSQYWDLIDTAHAQHTRISDVERKTDLVLGTIQIDPAEAAWNRLTPRKRLW